MYEYKDKNIHVYVYCLRLNTRTLVVKFKRTNSRFNDVYCIIKNNNFRRIKNK